MGHPPTCANSTARHAASGRRAHHRCSVLRVPMPDRFFPHRRRIDRFERNGDLDKFLFWGRGQGLLREIDEFGMATSSGPRGGTFFRHPPLIV